MEKKYIDKEMFLNFLKNNKEKISFKDLVCLVRLYSNYNLVNEITNGNYEQEIIKKYEDYIYTINDLVLSDKARIILELKNIRKKLSNNKDIIPEWQEQIENDLFHIENLLNYDKYTNYIKEQLSIIQTLLGLKITFFNSAYELFNGIYDRINNEKADNKRIK